VTWFVEQRLSGLPSELTYATVLPITTNLRAGVSMRIDLAPSRESGAGDGADWPQMIRLADMGRRSGHLDMAIMRARWTVVLGIGFNGSQSGRTTVAGLEQHRLPLPAIITTDDDRLAPALRLARSMTG
jgi:hypothetical protein